ncbi:cytochrome b5-related protein [Cephus cinctus]|uniref:Cytochrome b5-related protein n=1 Tax=Cephus cinctus TaxID=211228 RepID=A0AAJ7BZ45_CEPCN|nr:cytochrome b5-related protein [Cephus cinctus]
MGKLESTVPGLSYPSARDGALKTGIDFLDGRRKDDGAEGLWRIGNKLYDLSQFIKNHPGGSEWIALTEGTDITEAFQVHHLTDRAERLLPKFYIHDASTPRCIPLTFQPNGFYKKFKARALKALEGVDIHRPSPRTNMIADMLLAGTIISCLTASATRAWPAIIVSAMFLTWLSVTAHNYLHMRNNFRMFYMDLCLMSSNDWRITHVLSHHLYPNTIWDYEVYSVEPFLSWLPLKNKTIMSRILSLIYSPIIYTLTYVMQGTKRYYVALTKVDLHPQDLIPFILPLAMCTVSESIGAAFATWTTIIFLSSFYFGYTGFNAAHHHPDIFHDGDICRKDLDWALLELDAVRDRYLIDSSLFLTLTNFGTHTLHHLLPTVDHDYLRRCWPALKETCEEFNIPFKKMTQWELTKGQFQQLLRNEPKTFVS